MTMCAVPSGSIEMIRRAPGCSSGCVAIQPLFERSQTGSAHVVEEALVVGLAVVDVGAQDRVDRIDDVGARERGPEDAPERGVVARRAPEHQLVELLAL